MRLIAIAFLILAAANCSAPPAVIPASRAVPVAKPAPAAAPQARPTSTAPVRAPMASRKEISGIVFEGVAFDSRAFRLAVADQPAGPGSRFADSATAARAEGGIAAVNAGFFTPEGAPLGLVISGGNPAGSWNSASSLGGGAWHEDRTGNSSITRRENLGKARASSMRELIQAGPMLVENGRGTGGLEATKSSVRIVLLWGGGSRWWLGRGSACTLAALGQALAQGSPADWPIRHALNLDGGRSADLWISSAVEGGPILWRPAWNRPVRNFLVLVRR